MLTLLLIISPVASIAQTNQTPIVRTTHDFVVATGVVHVEDLEVAGNRQTHCVVTTNDGVADLTFDGRTITFGDGYTIVRTTLANTPTTFVTRFTATAPHARTATAIIARNLVSGETTGAGFEQYTALLRRSHDVQLAAGVLPLVGQHLPPPIPTATGMPTTGTNDHPGSGLSHAGVLTQSLRFKAAPMNACLDASFQYLVVSCAAVAACSLGPEDPACLVGIIALAGASYSLATNCGTYNDNTIGWG